jgi:uncharacterized membrane protein
MIQDNEPARAPRVPLVDVARGVAIVAMFVYHFTWDLGFFGFISMRAGIDPGWRLLAKVIAGSFLGLVGIGLVLAARGGLRPGPYLRRLGFVTLGATVITAATYAITPDAFVFFGILHCIAVSSVLAVPVLRAPAWWTTAMAAIVFVIPSVYRSPDLEGPAWWWLGLGEAVPITNDYVPVLPWFGCVLLGVALARMAVDSGWDVALSRWSPTDAITRTLAFGGRHSLLIYLVHQPLFFGLLSLAAAMGMPKVVVPATGAGFIPACTRACTDSGAAAGFCVATCACVGERLAANPDLLGRSMRGALPSADDATLRAVAQACQPAPAPAEPPKP